MTSPGGPVVFIGDSITDAARQTDAGSPLGEGYVRMVADLLAERGEPRTVINTGIGGDRIRDLIRRQFKDAIELRPSMLTVYVGVNDTWRRFDRGDPTSADAFATDYRAFLSTVRAHIGAQLVLMEPFLTPVSEDQMTWLEDLDGKRAVVRELAGEFGVSLVPLQSVMSLAASEHGAAAVAADGVHPTVLGHRLIAERWMRTVGFTS